QQQLSITNDVSSILGNLAPGFSPSRQKMSSTGETLRGRKPLCNCTLSIMVTMLGMLLTGFSIRVDVTVIRSISE
ncbi:MAG TPA: hypothetical protein DDW91_01600, partial [Shewanella frigidimarina]|nr:hypothetical protein [Shewanella frigidimarina]